MDQIFSVSLFFKIIYFIGLARLKGEGLTGLQCRNITSQNQVIHIHLC